MALRLFVKIFAPAVSLKGFVQEYFFAPAIVAGIINPRRERFLVCDLSKRGRAQLYVPSERNGLKTYETRVFARITTASKGGRPQW